MSSPLPVTGGPPASGSADVTMADPSSGGAPVIAPVSGGTPAAGGSTDVTMTDPSSGSAPVVVPVSGSTPAAEVPAPSKAPSTVNTAGVPAGTTINMPALPDNLRGFETIKEPYVFKLPESAGTTPKPPADAPPAGSSGGIPASPDAATSPQPGDQITVQLYRGILKLPSYNNSAGELKTLSYLTPADGYDSLKYVFLGAKPGGSRWILKDDFERMLSPGGLQQLYDMLKSNFDARAVLGGDPEPRRGKAKTVVIKPVVPSWTAAGSYYPTVDMTILNTPDPTKTMPDLASWQTSQRSQFYPILLNIAGANPSKGGGFNVSARFMQPNKSLLDDDFKLVFTPLKDPQEVDLAMLTKAASDTKAANKMPYEYEVLAYGDANAQGYKLLSTAPLQMYHTWIKPAHYTNVNTVLKIDPFLRAWPKQADADAWSTEQTVTLKLNKPDTGAVTKHVTLTFAKSEAAKKQERFPEQAAVLGASATDLAKKFWGKDAIKPDSNPKEAEWLHRSAFRFGGLTDSNDWNSSQDRDNLIFGTGEANTHMIREENFISSLITTYKPEQANAAILTTSIRGSGNMDRFGIDLTPKQWNIEDWVTTKSYKWLCMALDYSFRYRDTAKNVDFSNTVTFDPFSRYYPFRCETELDTFTWKALLSARVDKDDGTATPSAKKPKTSSKFVVRTVATTSEPIGDPSHAVLWQAAAASAPAVVSSGVTIQNPSVVPVSPPSLPAAPGMVPVPGMGHGAAGTVSAVIPPAAVSAPPVDGFTLVGDITLFGIKDLTAKFYSWKGPLPAGIMMGLMPPVYDRAVLDGEFHLSTVIEKLQGTPFDKIPFLNTTFTYQNYPFDTTRALGWHIDTDVMIDESCGAAHDVLSKVLGVQEPTLHLHAGIGSSQNWSTALKIPSFTLDGTFAGISVKLCNELTLTSLGIQLIGLRAMQMYPEPKEIMKYGFGIFGTMHLSVPGSTVPLELLYDITEMNGSVSLTADLTGDIWDDAFGIKNLTLSNVVITSSVDISSPLNSFNFGFMATFEHGITKAYFEGSYASGGAFALSASLSEFSLLNAYDLVEHFTGDKLRLPTDDIMIGSATIAVATGSGLTVALQNVQFGSYAAADATLTIGKAGVSLRGDITSHDSLTFGDIELKKAFIQIDFEKLETGNQTDVLLGGEVTIESLTIDAAVHIYEDADGAQWTVYAGLTSSGDTLALSKLVPELHGTFLDLPLTQVSFCAASQDDPAMQSFISSSSSPYAFHQGVQLCATFGSIDAMNALMRAPAGGFILNAGWSKATGFTLDILPPTPTIVHLGKGISTDPFTLRIQTAGGTPGLMLYAGLKIPTAHSDTPLDFKLALSIDPVGARASAELDGWWVDPFGISENVKIGPLVALSIEIIFEQFLSTGIPSGLGIAGGLQIGKAAASLAMEISEDPMHELLSAEVKNLDINDVIDFTNLLTDLHIPQPENFLQFNDVKLYICPAGTTLGTITYPRGFSFDASMVIFEKNAEIDCNVSTSGATIKGSVDDFKLGPLEVRGTTGPQATLDVEIGLSKQHIGIDGMATFYDSEVILHVDVDVMPKPAFTFFATLKFTDLLLFSLNAELVGAVSFKTIEQADFLFDALMEQHILQYVAEQLNKQFDTAKQAAEQGIDGAQKNVDDARKKMQAGIDDAQKKLNTASATWTQKRDSVTKAGRQTIESYNRTVSGLQNRVNAAKASYSQAEQDAHNKLQTATNERASKIAAAQHAVSSATDTMNSDVSNAQKKVSDAEAKMQKDFGNAEKSISDAQDKVNDLQNKINACQGHINSLNNLKKGNPKKIELVKYGPELAALKVSKEAADKILDAANAIVKGAGYAADEAAMKSAHAALDAGRSGGLVALSGAEETLKGVDAATAAAVKAAQESVDGIAKCSQAVAFTAATEALAAFKKANEAAFTAAMEAPKMLEGCAEKAAFDVASKALSAAKHASTGVDLANGALKVAEDGGEAALDAAKWAVDHATSLCDVRVIHLSGSLRGMLGISGKVEKPLTAHVEGVAAGQNFTFDGTFDPRKTADFITSIFEKLWNDIKSKAISL